MVERGDVTAHLWRRRQGLRGPAAGAQRGATPSRMVRVKLPCWLPLALGAVTPACWVVARASRTRRQFASGRCRKCGYDLRASPGRCPECGTVAAAR